MSALRLLLIGCIGSQAISATSERSLDSLLLNYDKSLPPPSQGVLAVEVTLSVDRLSTSEFGDTSLAYKLEAAWKDSRLTSDQARVKMDRQVLDRVWLPLIFTHDAIDSENLDEASVLHGDGRVSVSARRAVTSTGHLQNYPFDTHQFIISLVTDQHKRSNYEFQPYRLNESVAKSFHVIEANISDSMCDAFNPCVQLRIILRRKCTAFVLHAVVPLLVLVLSSLLSLFIDPARHSSARLIVASVLLAAAILVVWQTHALVPAASTIKVIDIWETASVLTVFFVLVQSIIVTNCMPSREGASEASFGLLTKKKRSGESRAHAAVLLIDCCSRIALPLLYASFTVVLMLMFAL